MPRESVILPLLICHWSFVIRHLSFERKLRLCRNPSVKLEDAFIHEPLSPLPLRPSAPLSLCPLIFVSLLDQRSIQ